MDADRAALDTDQLRRWRYEEGLSFTQCAERLFDETGMRYSGPDIVAAITRAPPVYRTNPYAEVIPWQVCVKHLKEYPARMLRLLGRRREGLPLSANEAQRLDAWLAKLETDHAVIGYEPTSVYGFYYVEKNDGTDGLDGVPVRREPIDRRG